MKAVIKLVSFCAGISLTAMAAAEVETRQLDEDKVLVSYSAADTSTSHGRETLERKIRRAAERVCGPQHLHGAGSVRQLTDNRACFNAAVANAMKDINRTA